MNLPSQPHSSAHPASGEIGPAAPDRIGRVALESGDDTDGFELWHATCRPVFEVGRRAPLRKFEAALEFYDVDGLVFNRTRYSATTFRRNASHLRDGEGDMIVLHMFLSGSERGEVERKGALAKGGDRIVLHDWAHPFTSVSEDCEQLSVAIPRERLAARDWMYEHQPVVGWNHQSSHGMMLGTALWGVWNALPHATRDEAPAMAAGFLGLLEGLLKPGRKNNEGRATLATMQAFLESRLHDPKVGVDDLTSAFRCSRATVYRLFGECHGVRAFLTERRLADAFQLLTASPDASRSINDLAGMVGFSDASYFHRAFKKRYGFTPREAAGAAQLPDTLGGGEEVSQAPSKALATIHRWMGLMT